MVPEGWKHTTLGEVTEFKNGLNFTKADKGESIKIVGVGDFKDLSELRSTDLLETIYVNSKVRDEELLKDGDLLFVRSNGNKDLIGRCLFFPSVTTRLSYSGFTIRGRVNKDLALPEYVASVARSSLMKQQISKSGGGTNISNLSQQILNDVVFLLPPLSEQMKIAKILSSWDKAIITIEQLLASSQQQKKALMQQLLTGKKRLLDKNGVRFSGEWKWSKIQEVGMVVTGSTPPKSDENNYGGDVLWATAEDFTGKYVSDTKIKLSDKGSTKARIVPKGSVLVTCIASIGKNAIANEDMGTNQQINAVVVSDSFSNEFFYYQIEFNVNKLISIAGVTAVPIVNKSSFQQVKLIFPVLEEQQKIAVVLSTADQEISALQQKLEALKQEKKALMQQLLTGKRRVKIDNKEFI